MLDNLANPRRIPQEQVMMTGSRNEHEMQYCVYFPLRGTIR